MDKFLDLYDITKLNQEDKSHLNRSITSNESEAVIKSQPTKKSPVQNGFKAKFYQTFMQN
jgi:hypothetical protein